MESENFKGFTYPNSETLMKQDDAVLIKNSPDFQNDEFQATITGFKNGYVCIVDGEHDDYDVEPQYVFPDVEEELSEDQIKRLQALSKDVKNISAYDTMPAELKWVIEVGDNDTQYKAATVEEINNADVLYVTVKGIQIRISLMVPNVILVTPHDDKGVELSEVLEIPINK